MWSTLSKVGQLLGLVSLEPPVDLEAIAAVLDQEETPADEEISSAPVQDNEGSLCQERVGIVTALHNTYGFLKSSDSDDSQLHFLVKDSPEGLRVGDQVVYLAFKLSDTSVWTVRKILQIESEVWSNVNGEEKSWEIKGPIVSKTALWYGAMLDLNLPHEAQGLSPLQAYRNAAHHLTGFEKRFVFSDPKEECEVAFKHVVAKVTGRDGRTVLVGHLQFCLDSVKVDFIPVEGDWVLLQSIVQAEESADTVLVVERVSALRSQLLEGEVTHWNSDAQMGIIKQEVVFNKEACESGYLPKVGDKVRVYCIESDQGQLTWRAVLVVPISSRQQQPLHDPQALAALLSNKCGVILSDDTNFGTLNIGKAKEISVEVRNESDLQLTLIGINMTSQDSQFCLEHPVVTSHISIPPGLSLNFVFKATARFVGPTTELVVFNFNGFEIGRQLVVDVQSAALTASLTGARGKGVQSRNAKQEPITAKKLLATRNGLIVPGVKPIKPACFVPVHLGMFIIPEKLTNTVLDSELYSRTDELTARLRETYECLREPLTPQNYVLRWDTLIHLEELAHASNISRYNTTSGMQRVQDYLSLEIPGLAERRPSLIVGDRVIARATWNDDSWGSKVQDKGYEGYIHKVLSNEILLKFNPNFHDTCSGVYSVVFEQNRTNFRREHQAVHVAFRNLSAEWLFPSCVSYKPPQIIITDEEAYEYFLKENKETTLNKEPEEEIIHETKIGEADKPSETDEASNVCLFEKHQNCVLTNDMHSNVDVENKTLKDCDKIIENNRVSESGNYASQQFKTEISKDCINGDTQLSSEHLIAVEKSIDNILNTATQILSEEEKAKSNKHREPSEKRVKRKSVSDMFDKPAFKDKAPPKISPPRVPVVERFLQNGNRPTKKSPKDVENILQQLAILTPKESVPNNNNMKTVEEIEKSLFNNSNCSSSLSGIEPLSDKRNSSVARNMEKSPSEQFLNGNNFVDVTTENKEVEKIIEEKILSSKVDEKTEEDLGKGSKRNTNQSAKKAYKNDQNKIKWNSNAKMKIGNEKESKVKLQDRRRRKIKWFNPLLNHYQKEAVRNILKGEARPLPYVIFGPPGTGKTITLVEAVLQIYFIIPESRLLIGTPSNSSADLVCERLLDSGLLVPGDLLRLMGHRYADQGIISDRLRQYTGCADIKAQDDFRESRPQKEGVINMSRHAIGRHRITVGTCNTLGVLYQLGFPQGHFTHFFVDEAGQAKEPEILIPLVFLHNSCGQAILAGDPLQLGPVVLSRPASNLGLAESFLSRLLSCSPYLRDIIGFPDSGGYNPNLVTRLVYNYRSLPEILSLPNDMFYNGDLIPKVSESSSDEAVVLTSLKSVLPQRDSEKGPPAVVFHGVRGTNCQAEDSPSWHNPHEAVQACMYLQAFYAAGLSEDQCGIITPYQAQVLKIREMLETLEVPIPKVGSVEEFQGQERVAVILSTVRSSPRRVESDVRHTVGFVASPQRLNVAITRARAVLIIVGNPHLLALDQHWRTVLEYCVKCGAYTGCDLPTLGL